MKLLYVLILALALAVFLRAADYFLGLATRGKSWHQHIRRIFPWFELGAWLAFAFWSIENLFARTELYPFLMGALAVVVIASLGWFVLREWVAGAMLRADQALEPGVFIKTQGYEGTVQSVGLVSLELLTAEGEKVKVPWSSLSGKGVFRTPGRGQGKSQCLRLKIAQKYGAGTIQQALRRKLLELPWVVAGYEVKVQLTPSGADYLAEVYFQSIKEEMLSQTQEVLLDFVRDQFP